MITMEWIFVSLTNIAKFLLYKSDMIWKWNKCRITSKTKTGKYLEI